MRSSCALVFLVLFSWLGGLGQDARAEVTIDIVFRDATVPSGITTHPGDPGPGCTFGGYYGGSVSTGYCMDVMLYTPVPLIALTASVAYDSDNGLAVASLYEWKGIGVSFDKGGVPQKECAPVDGVADNGGVIEHFDCIIPPPNLTTPLPPGTYKIGTIIWHTSSTTLGTELIQVVDGSVAGNFVSPIPETFMVVPGSHTLSIVPEQAAVPSMGPTGMTVLGVAVFGIGIVGLVIAARRRFN